MSSVNCHPQSYPSFPDTSTHHLWMSWDMVLEALILQAQRELNLKTGSLDVAVGDAAVGISIMQPQPPVETYTVSQRFFQDQLSAFETWLQFHHDDTDDKPLELPMLLQALCSKANRVQSMLLLRRYVALGPSAVTNIIALGFKTYLINLLSPGVDHAVHLILLQVWTYILGYDISMRSDLVRNRAVDLFCSQLGSEDFSPIQRSMAACSLAQICNGYQPGKELLLSKSVHEIVINMLGQSTPLSPTLCKWSLLCVYKLLEGYIWAKYLVMTEALHMKVYPYLVHFDSSVRAAAVMTLGECFGASAAVLAIRDKNAKETENRLHASELQLSTQILECFTDGSAFVRREAVIALSKFSRIEKHFECLKAVVWSIDDICDSSCTNCLEALKVPVSMALVVNSVSSFIDKQRHERGLPLSRIDRDRERDKGMRTDSEGASTDNLSTPSSGTRGPPLITSNHSVAGKRGMGSTLEQGQSLLPVEDLSDKTKEMNGTFHCNGHTATTTASSTDAQNILNNAKTVIHQELQHHDSSLIETSSDKMAPAYVRLWLALWDLHRREPHPVVQTAAGTAATFIRDAALEEHRSYSDEISPTLFAQPSFDEDHGTAPGNISHIIIGQPCLIVFLLIL